VFVTAWLKTNEATQSCARENKAFYAVLPEEVCLKIELDRENQLMKRLW